MNQKILLIILSLHISFQTLHAVERKPISSSWMRLENDAHHMRISGNGRYLAYTDGFAQGLRILDLKTAKVYDVSNKKVDGSYIWAPDGHRLLYRELRPNLQSADKSSNSNNTINSEVKAYDAFLHKSILIDSIPQATGFLTFDPRDQKLQILGEKSVISHQLIFPDVRVAKWQMAARPEKGKWLVTPQAVLWASLGGRAMDPMPDDGKGVESFAISPDGQSIAWATKSGFVYVSRNGQAPENVGYGRDPTWHPEKSILLYSAARKIGTSTSDYDLRVIDQKGHAKWVTNTQHSKERWPQWMPRSNQIVYTKDRTTDLFIMDFYL